MAEHKERQAWELERATLAWALEATCAINRELGEGRAPHAHLLSLDLQESLQHKLDRTNEGLEMCLLWEKDNE